LFAKEGDNKYFSTFACPKKPETVQMIPTILLECSICQKLFLPTKYYDKNKQDMEQCSRPKYSVESNMES
jgi:hypothetical protein